VVSLASPWCHGRGRHVRRVAGHEGAVEAGRCDPNDLGWRPLYGAVDDAFGLGAGAARRGLAAWGCGSRRTQGSDAHLVDDELGRVALPGERRRRPQQAHGSHVSQVEALLAKADAWHGVPRGPEGDAVSPRRPGRQRCPGTVEATALIVLCDDLHP